jgi:hypothetical protein
MERLGKMPTDCEWPRCTGGFEPFCLLSRDPVYHRSHMPWKSLQDFHASQCETSPLKYRKKLSVPDFGRSPCISSGVQFISRPRIHRRVTSPEQKSAAPPGVEQAPSRDRAPSGIHSGDKRPEQISLICFPAKRCCEYTNPSCGAIRFV